jgi:hypothetical protein
MTDLSGVPTGVLVEELVKREEVKTVDLRRSSDEYYEVMSVIRKPKCVTLHEVGRLPARIIVVQGE